MKIKIWILCLVFCVSTAFMLNACGLYNTNQASVFSSVGSPKSGDGGDGKIPDLTERLNSNPSLNDKDCDEIKSCQTVCEAIYDDTNSEDECLELSFGKVTEIEDVYEALLEADSNDLEDIDTGDLEDYLKIGIDGWLDVIIPKQVTGNSSNPHFEKIFNTLKWISEEKQVADALSDHDQNHEILEKLFLKYCNPDSSGDCQNTNGKDITDKYPTTGTNSFQFNRSNDEFKCGSTRIKTISSSSSDKKLLVSLSFSKDNYKTGINNFFITTNKDNEDAFLIAHSLLSNACDHDLKCIAGFYCWLNSFNNHDGANQPAKDKNDIFQTKLNTYHSEGDIPEEINLRSCTTQNFNCSSFNN